MASFLRSLFKYFKLGYFGLVGCFEENGSGFLVINSITNRPFGDVKKKKKVIHSDSIIIV